MLKKEKNEEEEFTRRHNNSFSTRWISITDNWCSQCEHNGTEVAYPASCTVNNKRIRVSQKWIFSAIYFFEIVIRDYHLEKGNKKQARALRSNKSLPVPTNIWKMCKLASIISSCSIHHPTIIQGKNGGSCEFILEWCTKSQSLKRLKTRALMAPMQMADGGGGRGSKKYLAFQWEIKQLYHSPRPTETIFLYPIKGDSSKWLLIIQRACFNGSCITWTTWGRIRHLLGATRRPQIFSYPSTGIGTLLPRTNFNWLLRAFFMILVRIL